MIANRLSCFCCLILNLALLPAANAQPPANAQSAADSVFYRQSLARLSETYHKDMGPASRLYTGAEYLGSPRAKGSPFFLTDGTLPGSVIYQGEAYDSLDLQYDLLSGVVLIKDYTHNYNIELTKEKVTRFTIAHHEFWYLAPGQPATPDRPAATNQPVAAANQPSDRSPDPIEPGYYERLNTTAPFLFVRREKKIAIPANVEEQAFYRSYNSWFLQVGGRFYRIESKSGLLEVLKDKKDPLKKYIRESRVNFNKDFEQALIKTTAYYAQLTN